MKVAAVDLFCGIGGLTRGLISAGIPVVAGYDLDETCKYAYETNNNSTFYYRDITTLAGAEILHQYPVDCLRILVGCSPCQPFSKHTQKDKARGQGDDWKLLYSFSRLIEEVQPTIVSMENVCEISYTEVFLNFIETLKTQEYFISWSKVYCPDYGIPQSRRRLVLLASKLGEIRIIPPTHTPEEYPTIEQTICSLPPIEAGASSPNDLLHRSSALNDLNLKRIRQSKPGGTWRDWDEELLSPCHKKKSGKSYSGVYARMSWDRLAPTITTQFYNYGTGRFGHPEQDRALSIREGALLQTFPPDYKFIDPKIGFSIKSIGTQIGNAVPVRLGYVIGISIIEHIKESYKNGE